LSAASDIVRSAGGAELFERLEHLDRVRIAPAADRVIAGPTGALDYDVVFAGGGLSILIAAALAKQGVRVAVFERARAGVAHREWNASMPELLPLKTSGLIDDLDEICLAKYDYGICHFHGGKSYPVHGVLDVAVDASALLSRVRARAEAWGVQFFDRATLVAHGESSRGISAEFAIADGSTNNADHRAGDTRPALRTTARILVDARGASSPLGQADLVCPTVGGVLTGIDFDPKVGEILITTEGVEDGVQHVWEGFPGRSGELTTYLFYYADRDKVMGRPLLMPLYARFFSTLERYKPGAAALLRPTFGYIPGWSRTTPAADLLAAAALGEGTLASEIMQDASIHQWTGSLAKLMASGAFAGNAMNELLDTAFGALHSMGDAAYAACLKDQMGARDFYRFVSETSRRRPAVFSDVVRGLGPIRSMRWAYSVLSRAALAS
jgi:lycopene cyclase CruA